MRLRARVPGGAAEPAGEEGVRGAGREARGVLAGPVGREGRRRRRRGDRPGSCTEGRARTGSSPAVGGRGGPWRRRGGCVVFRAGPAGRAAAPGGGRVDGRRGLCQAAGDRRGRGELFFFVLLVLALLILDLGVLCLIGVWFCRLFWVFGNFVVLNEFYGGKI